MDEGSLVYRFASTLPGILFGAVLGVCWYIAFGFLSVTAVWSAMWGSRDAASSLSFLAPHLNIFVLAIVFSSFRKYNMVTGILLVAIGFLLYFSYPTFLAFYAWHAQP